MLELATAKTIHSSAPWVPAKQLKETHTTYFCCQVKKKPPLLLSAPLIPRWKLLEQSKDNPIAVA